MQSVLEEFAGATSGDDNGKNAVARRNPLELTKLTNFQKKSEEHVLP